MKKIKLNRNVVILLSFLVIGILGIGIMAIVESDGAILSTNVAEEDNSNYKTLQAKIESFTNNANWKPEDYQTLATEIEASQKNDLISSSIKNNLIVQLNLALEEKTFQKCELYLLSKSALTNNDVKQLIMYLQKVTAASSKITFYKNQVSKYHYFEKTLPNKIKYFISNYDNYSDDGYENYLIEVKSLPGLETKFKNQPKFKNISTKLKNDLDRFNYNYYQSLAEEAANKY